MKIKEGLVIHCNTEEKARKLLTELDKQGYVWGDGSNLLTNIRYEDYKEETCYLIRENKELMYGDIESCVAIKCEIIEFDDLEIEEADEFEPNKSYLMKHKDKYVVEYGRGDFEKTYSYLKGIS